LTTFPIIGTIKAWTVWKSWKAETALTRFLDFSLLISQNYQKENPIMCLIVFNPHGHKLPEDRMRVAFKNNGDGYGFMWNEDGRVKVLKEDGSAGVERFLHLVDQFKGTAHAIHLRWRTHGELGTSQCHPHVVLNKDSGDKVDFMMMHNGVFHGLPNDSVKSDSAILAARLRENIHSNGGDFKAAIQSLDKHIGNNNRVLFLNSHGKAIFLNAGLGFWDNGIWYSNTYSFAGLGYSVKPVTHYTLSGGKLIPRTSAGIGTGAVAALPVAKPVVAKPAVLKPVNPAHAVAVAPVDVPLYDDGEGKVIWPPSSSKLIKDHREKLLTAGRTSGADANDSRKLVLSYKQNKKARKLEKKKARKLIRQQAKQVRLDSLGNERTIRIFTLGPGPQKVSPVVSKEYPPTEAKLLSRG
jgi:hypothetical protein